MAASFFLSSDKDYPFSQGTILWLMSCVLLRDLRSLKRS